MPGNILPIDIDWLKTEFYQAVEAFKTETLDDSAAAELNRILARLLDKIPKSETFEALTTALDAWLVTSAEPGNLIRLSYSSSCFDEGTPGGNPFDHNYVFGELVEAFLHDYCNRLPSWLPKRPDVYAGSGPHDSVTFHVKHRQLSAENAPELLRRVTDLLESLTHGGLSEIEIQEVEGMLQELRCCSGPTQQTIDKAVDHAEQAFWAELVNHFPEVDTGDYPPEASFQIREDLKSHVEKWLKYNHPALKGTT